MQAHLFHKKLTLVNEESVLEGKIILTDIARIHGLIKGELQAKEGSTVILAETGVIEGTVHADTLLVYGFIRGDVVVQKRLVLGQTARVIGNIMTQSLSLEFGAYFEGSCKSSPFVEKKA